MKIWWMIVMGVVFLGNSALVEAQRDYGLEKAGQDAHSGMRAISRFA